MVESSPGVGASVASLADKPLRRSGTIASRPPKRLNDYVLYSTGTSLDYRICCCVARVTFEQLLNYKSLVFILPD